MQINNDGSLEIVEKDGMTYYVVNETVDGVKSIMYIYVYKTADAFWIVQFCSTAEKAERWADCYQDWAKSIEFK